MKMKTKIKAKNILVFLAIAIVLVSASLASAYTSSLAYVDSIEVNGIEDSDVSVIAGETIAVRVVFEATVDATDVKFKAELQGTKLDASALTTPFAIEKGKVYSKILKIKIPYELKDDISDDLFLNCRLWNGEYTTNLNQVRLRVQRPIYNADIMSISTRQSIDAGETLPIDLAIKNTGYNKLDDLYVTVKVKELDIKNTFYLGDLIAKECYDNDDCNENNKDTVVKRTYLKIPYNAEPKVYTIEVEARNNDMTINEVQEILVQNEFSTGNVVVSSYVKNLGVRQEGEFDLVIVNPTNKIKVYRVNSHSTNNNLEVDVENEVIVVPAGSSKTVKVFARAGSKGNYDFDINVFSGENLISQVTLTAKVQGASNPIYLLTIVLAVIFVVLLVALVVLIAKKPREKNQDFGESSYY
jgi:hypothetical protein